MLRLHDVDWSHCNSYLFTRIFINVQILFGEFLIHFSFVYHSIAEGFPPGRNKTITKSGVACDVSKGILLQSDSKSKFGTHEMVPAEHCHYDESCRIRSVLVAERSSDRLPSLWYSWSQHNVPFARFFCISHVARHVFVNVCVVWWLKFRYFQGMGWRLEMFWSRRVGIFRGQLLCEGWVYVEGLQNMSERFSIVCVFFLWYPDDCSD